MKRAGQLAIDPALEKMPRAFGGELMKTRKGRLGFRPLVTKTTMHLVLRSTKAKGEWSFRAQSNDQKIREIIERFSAKYAVRVLSLANVGNHLHLQIQLFKRNFYKPFIRAITSAIAMAVTGASRWNKLKNESKDKFWDYRPFTRIVVGRRAFLTLRDYIRINILEGQGAPRAKAVFWVKNWHAGLRSQV
jgi:REP element-mobilizing transposase RayT